MRERNLILCHNHTRVFPLYDLEIDPVRVGEVFPYRPVRFTIPTSSAPPGPDAGYSIHDPDAHEVVAADVVVTQVMRFGVSPDDLRVEGWIAVRDGG
jgi:hypothetical protein